MTRVFLTNRGKVLKDLEEQNSLRDSGTAEERNRSGNSKTFKVDPKKLRNLVKKLLLNLEDWIKR